MRHFLLPAAMALGLVTAAVVPAEAHEPTDAEAVTVAALTQRQPASFSDLRTDRVMVVIQGRGISTLAPKPANELTFEQKADLLAQRGIPMNSVAVEAYTGERSRLSLKGRIYSSVPDLQALVARGGSVASGGIEHTALPAVGPGAQWDDTCGGDQRFFDPHGLNAQSMYAYAANAFSMDIQLDLVSKCYAFGRFYPEVETRNSLVGLQTSPWVLQTVSLNGGCNTENRTCNGVTTPQQYLSVARLRAFLSAPQGQLSVLQHYSLVSGRSSGKYAWNCQGASATHWTNKTEIYCANDFFSAIDGAAPAVRTASLARLAEVMGRSPAQLPGISREEYVATHS